MRPGQTWGHVDFPLVYNIHASTVAQLEVYYLVSSTVLRLKYFSLFCVS